MRLDSRISLYKLEVLCLVAELGSVSRAAERLFVTQPVVSAHLHSLQDRIGVQLLQREGRGIELTPAGVVVCEWARELLSSRDDLVRRLEGMADGSAGSVKIGASTTVGNYVLAPALIEFRQRNRGADVSLWLSTAEDTIDAVRAGSTDFCVVAAPGVLSREGLRCELAGRQRVVLVAAPEDDSVPDRIGLERLRTLSWVCPPSGQATRRSQDQALAAMGVLDRRVSIELGSAEAIKRAVLAGLGVALLWDAAVREEIETGILREVTVDARPVMETFFLLTRDTKILTPLQRRVRTVMTQAVSGLPTTESVAVVSTEGSSAAREHTMRARPAARAPQAVLTREPSSPAETH